MPAKLILYIASSLDGYIAGPDDNLEFLSLVEMEGEDYGYSAFIQTIDTVIIGRKTYDWVMNHVREFPHAEKETFVITRNKKQSAGKLTFFNGNLKELVIELKTKNTKNIFCDGGAEIVNLLMQDNLIDEFIISVIPVFLGAGTRLFKNGLPQQKLELISSKSFETGLVQLHYKKREP